jgi:hypothetical protein
MWTRITSNRSLAVLLALGWLLATAANWGEVIMGSHPTVSGLLATGAYLAIWLVIAVAVRRSHRLVSLYWAPVIALTTVCWLGISTVFASDGVLEQAAWLPLLLLLLLTPSMYGVAGFVHSSQPLLDVVAFDVAWYALLLIVSLVSQRVGSRNLRTT